MSEPAAAIERRQGDALSQIVGTGNTRALLEQVERNVKDVVAVARERGFVSRFGGKHEFFGFPAWSLLALTYGLVPFTEWTRKVDNGWEARAIVRTRDGETVAAAEAMCTRQEPNRRNASEHDLRAMAQTRAMRNALRSCLGAALVLSGFDFADPDAPVDDDQLAALHISERSLGMTHEEGHADAGVDSYKKLTREQAHEVITRRQRMLEVSDAVSPHFPTSDAGEQGSSSEQGTPEEKTTLAYGEGAATPTSGAPDLDELWRQALVAGLTIKRAKPFAASQGIKVNAAHELTAEQMTVLLAKWRERGK